jgi:hypothetical protein
VRTLLHYNFVVAVWLCIALWLAQAVGFATHLQALHAMYGPFMAKVGLAPLALAFAQLLFWFRFYRFGGRIASLGAGIFGTVFVLIVLVQLLRQTVSEGEAAGGSVALYLYFAASHFAYALSGPRGETA